jgi:hypothetical protein
VVAVVAGVVFGAAMLVGCGSGVAGRVVQGFTTGAEGADQYKSAATECGRAHAIDPLRTCIRSPPDRESGP